MGEDILSVVFLALIAIVVAGIVYKLAPDGMVMPTFALIAICLWIAYDYMMIKRYKAKAACGKAQSMDEEIQILANKLNEKSGDRPAPEPDAQQSPPAAPIPAKKEHSNEFDIDLYGEQLTMAELFKSSGCTGDTRIANRMKYMAMQPKIAKDNRARFNCEKLRPFLEDELRTNEARDWWETEVAHLDTLM